MRLGYDIKHALISFILTCDAFFIKMSIKYQVLTTKFLGHHKTTCLGGRFGI